MDLHWYTFQIVSTYLNKTIKYCGPQPIYLFERVFQFPSVSTLFKNNSIHFLKDYNIIIIPGSHILIVSNQTFYLKNIVWAAGGVILFIAFVSPRFLYNIVRFLGDLLDLLEVPLAFQLSHLARE